MWVLWLSGILHVYSSIYEIVIWMNHEPSPFHDTIWPFLLISLIYHPPCCPCVDALNFLALQRAVFQGLSQEALSACIHSLLKASDVILKNKVGAYFIFFIIIFGGWRSACDALYYMFLPVYGVIEKLNCSFTISLLFIFFLYKWFNTSFVFGTRLHLDYSDVIFRAMASSCPDAGRRSAVSDQTPADHEGTDRSLPHRLCHQGDLSGPEENQRWDGEEGEKRFLKTCHHISIISRGWLLCPNAHGYYYNIITWVTV